MLLRSTLDGHNICDQQLVRIFSDIPIVLTPPDRMYININMVATAFLKAGNLVDLAADALGKGRPETIAGGLQRGDVLRLTKMFKVLCLVFAWLPDLPGRNFPPYAHSAKRGSSTTAEEDLQVYRSDSA